MMSRNWKPRSVGHQDQAGVAAAEAKHTKRSDHSHHGVQGKKPKKYYLRISSKALYPIGICLLDANAIVPEPNLVPKLIQ